eukprot:CAMPEP_0202344926 /NCGR_PEP_ID=MMETSP1126-20121109/4390_1 /ASSEMBLY_ACC=CAM_ASM_000457 /TAXON_ID=3047 /ORGANISM="Dunaliella tertiolecta, Strain CCMP1320" /LENGTH=1494 /DNA_ID=CAMNT_0048936169 /DNA_START=95 /DNA_END=4579 /DNA_ORIENTATION=-
MGVHGLLSLLNSSKAARQRVCLDGKASAPREKILLVDASAVQFHILQKLDLDWRSQDFNKTLYKEASRFYSGLLQVGLQPLLVLDSACAPGHEETHTQRRVAAHRSGKILGPTSGMVMYHVYKDLGLQVEQSIHSADKLLLALYHKHRSNVFALLTGDTDFAVYGVPKVVMVGNAVVDAGTVTFTILNTLEAWKELSRAAALRNARPGAALPPAMLPDLCKRAQVAALLGNDKSKDVRHRLQARNGQTRKNGGGFSIGAVLSPKMAAFEVLVRDDLPMDLAFFHNTLKMRSFNEQALQEFQEVVQEYVQDDEFARAPTAIEQLKITPASLPWLPEPLVRMLDREPLPGLMLAFASRGFFVPMDVPTPCKALLQDVRRRAASVLAAPGAAVHEFCYITETLQRLLGQGPEGAKAAAGGAAGGQAGPRAVDWFVPSTHLPAAQVVDATGSVSAAEIHRSMSPVGRTMQETAAAVQKACETVGAVDVAPNIAAYYAILLHALEPTAPEAEPGQFRTACRELLLPGVTIYTPEMEEQEFEQEQVPLADGEAAKVVDVGSGLSQDDWNEIDDKGVVNSVKSSTGYKIMGELQPYQPASELQAAALPTSKLFHLFYVLSQKGMHADSWKKVTKACFPTEYADIKADKAKAKELQATPKDTLLQELKAERSTGASYALTWFSRLSNCVEGGGSVKEQAALLLAVMKDAVLGGQGSLQWRSAQVCLEAASPTVKQAAKEEMWSGSNSMIGTGGKAMRYPQQQEIMDMVQEHFEDAKASTSPQPLHVILSTPTGSGKTFTAVMLHLHLLKQHYPDQILVYSVPTKQVLKRVGQECEAHGVIYWTAAKDGNMHQVRRPYSIRTERGDKRTQTSGPIHEQMSMTASQGINSHDIGGGHPSVIIADIDSTAALMKAAREAPPSSFYHSTNLLLYLDEPNMGLQLDPRVYRVVREIMANAPFTTILASATLPPSWDFLPKWWRGRGGAVRASISLEPYGLPMSRLQLLSSTHGMRVQLNMLQLFRSYVEFHQAVSTNQRLRVLLVRHLSPKQANQLLLMQGRESADNGAVPESEEDLVTLFGREVSSLRESLEPQLVDMSAQQFEQLRNVDWAERPEYAPGGLLAAQSTQGVTLIATLHPREVALEVAGIRNRAAWGDAVRAMRAKISEAVQAQRQQAKEQQRSRKDEDGPPLGGEDTGSPMVTLRMGLKVDIEDTQGTDIDTLVMLSKGVAYASSGVDQDPLVKRLYQQALLRVPEKAGKQPPLTRLVVDYSGIYGTDCPSVDTIIMHPSLGRLLSFDDHLQFIGRLRRDGVAIYPSLSMLRSATTGLRSDARDTELLGEARSEAMRDALAPLLTADPPKSATEVLAEAQAKKSDGDMADGNALCGAWAALISGLKEKSPDELKKELIRRAKAYAKVLGAFANSGKVELSLLKYMQRLCFQAEKHLEPHFALMLRVLYEVDVLSEDAILHWYHKGSDPAGRDVFLPQTEALVKWLEEESEEEEESD